MIRIANAIAARLKSRRFLTGLGLAGSAGPRLRTLLVAAGAAVTALAAGELACRLDDRLFADIALSANPDREFDLLTAEAWGWHGKPFGSYRKWRLNNYGFQGPDLAPQPAAHRVMVLGASETFGLYEKAGNSYPAILARTLSGQGLADIEIVNAALPGMALPSMTTFWQEWASRFKPQTVLVYPSPLFYLEQSVPRPLASPVAQPPPGLRLRVLERLLDQLKQVPLLRTLRARFIVGQALTGTDPHDLFTEQIPLDRLAAFSADLEKLAASIEARGSRPVLITHAFKTTSPPHPADRADLDYFRIFYPRVTPAGFPAFEAAARDAVIALGRRRAWPVIDVAADLTGRRELFADPVHFNDAGSQVMARLIAARLPEIAGPGAKR